MFGFLGVLQIGWSKNDELVLSIVFFFSTRHDMLESSKSNEKSSNFMVDLTIFEKCGPAQHIRRTLNRVFIINIQMLSFDKVRPQLHKSTVYRRASWNSSIFLNELNSSNIARQTTIEVFNAGNNSISIMTPTASVYATNELVVRKK